ncbi:MAG: hypothetical protein KTV77_04705 [Wolbachia endosymbiont of Fragariocoptes setiger]|nr:hypothetical protein [Wolbachia endosymbiont of Fragariocoptes setiger]
MRYNNGQIYFASCEKDFSDTVCKIQKGYESLFYSEIPYDWEFLDAVYNAKNKLRAYEKLDFDFVTSHGIEEIINKIEELVDELS